MTRSNGGELKLSECKQLDEANLHGSLRSHKHQPLTVVPGADRSLKSGRYIFVCIGTSGSAVSGNEFEEVTGICVETTRKITRRLDSEQVR